MKRNLEFFVAVFKDIYLYLYLDFLKTNFAKSAVIWVKRRQKAGFWGAKSSKMKLTIRKKRRKKRARREKGVEEKKAMVALLVFIMAVFDRQKLLDEKGQFGVNVFKNPAR